MALSMPFKQKVSYWPTTTSIMDIIDESSAVGTLEKMYRSSSVATQCQLVGILLKDTWERDVNVLQKLFTSAENK
jgi:hypothetical protein